MTHPIESSVTTLVASKAVEHEARRYRIWAAIAINCESKAAYRHAMCIRI